MMFTSQIPLPASVAPFHCTETSLLVIALTVKELVTTGSARSITTFAVGDQALLLPTKSTARIAKL